MAIMTTIIMIAILTTIVIVAIVMIKQKNNRDEIK